MAAPTQIRSPYDRRGALVKETIRVHSKIGDEAAGELAVQVLNSIPERVG